MTSEQEKLKHQIEKRLDRLGEHYKFLKQYNGIFREIKNLQEEIKNIHQKLYEISGNELCDHICEDCHTEKCPDMTKYFCSIYYGPKSLARINFLLQGIEPDNSDWETC